MEIEKVFKLSQTEYRPYTAFFFKNISEVNRFKIYFENKNINIKWDPVEGIDKKELSVYHKEMLELSPEQQAERNEEWLKVVSSR
jgi:hypothetical protein